MLNTTNTPAQIGFSTGESPANNLLIYLESHRRRFPEKTALKWISQQTLDEWDHTVATPLEHETMTYAGLHDRIRRTAGGLQQLGIEKGDRVVIFLPMSPPLYQSLLAVLQNGAIAVFLESWARRSQLATSIRQVDPKAIISVERAFELGRQIPAVAQIPLKISADATGDTDRIPLAELQESAPRRRLEPVRGDHTALVTYSTGSSGQPKGANRTHRFLAGQHRALDRVIPYRDDDVDLPAFPVFSLNNLAGGTTTTIPAIDVGSPTDDDPLILTNQLVHGAVRCTTLSPSMLRAVADCCADQDIELGDLRRVVTGGAPITNDDLQSFKAIAPNAEIRVLYGSTEVEPIAHITADELLDPADDPTQDDAGVNVGHVVDDLDYKFVRIHHGNIDLRDGGWANWEVDDGEIGEIVVAGDHVCKSYYNNAEATRKTKIVDADGTVWHRTGDLGRQDRQGCVWLVGRVHNAIRRGDEWVFPVQAEVALKQLEFTDRAAFLGIPDDELGERSCAAVTLHPDAPAHRECKRRIYTALQIRDIPVDQVVIVDDIPMDPRHNSKVEYDKLRDQILQLTTGM